MSGIRAGRRPSACAVVAVVLLASALAASGALATAQRTSAPADPTAAKQPARSNAASDTTSFANAQKISLDVAATAMIGDFDRVDYFTFTLDAATDVIARSTGEHPGLIGSLFDSDGGFITSNDKSGYAFHPEDKLDSRFLMRARLDAGTYYLKVNVDGWRYTRAYWIAVERVIEPGHDRNSAVVMGFNDMKGGNLDTAGEADYFRINVPAATALVLRATSAQTSVDLDVLDASGRSLGLHTQHHKPGRWIPHLTTLAARLEAGTHYVRVTGAGVGSYSLFMQRDHEQNREIWNACRSTSATTISDPLYGMQWNLRNDGSCGRTEGVDINIEPVWNAGHTGAGVGVAINDDGVDVRHADLHQNFDLAKNHSYVGWGIFHHNGRTWHGTNVAGIIGARDNGIGIRGVAPRATLFGYDFLNRTTLANRTDSISRGVEYTAVHNNSWGSGHGTHYKHGSRLEDLATEKGLADGFGGKGTVYVWSAGNGDGRGDYHTLEYRQNHHGNLNVCAVGPDGKKAHYSEPGPALWVCAPSRQTSRKLTTGITTTHNYSRYKRTFGGTSAAAPTVTGVVALLRGAYPELTWRDVKLILAGSATKIDADGGEWLSGALRYGQPAGGARYSYSNLYGFGLVNAEQAFELAADWVPLGVYQSATAAYAGEAAAVPHGDTPVELTALVGDTINFVEHVTVDVDIDTEQFRDLRIELHSPSGKSSLLVPSHNGECSKRSMYLCKFDRTLRFSSLRHLGEDAAGTWTLKVRDEHNPDAASTIKGWRLTVRGHHSEALPRPTAEVVSVGQTSAKVGWAAPDPTPAELAVASYDLRWISYSSNDKTDPANWTVVTGVGAADVRTHTVEELTSETAYDVQVRAVWSDGTVGLWSDRVTATPRDPRPVPAASIVGTGITAAVVGWSGSEGDTGGMVAESYDLAYIAGASTDAAKADPESWTLVTGAGGADDRRVRVDGLTRDAAYDFRVRAVWSSDPHGLLPAAGSWSAVVTATPHDPRPVPTVRLSKLRKNSVQLDWVLSGDRDGPTPESFDVRYIESSSTDAAKGDPANWTVIDNAGAGDDRSYSLEGLVEGTSYDVQVRAVWSSDPAGLLPADGSWSVSLAVVPEDLRPVPELSVSSVARDSVTVNWTAPVDASGELSELSVASYDIRYVLSTSPSTAGEADWTLVTGAGDADARSYTIEGLTVDNVYGVSVRAVWSDEADEWADDAGVWADALVATPRDPRPVPTVSMMDVRDVSALVRWTAPVGELGGMSVVSYDVRYIDRSHPGKADGANWTVVAGAGGRASRNATVSGLTQDVTYDMQVRAVWSVDPAGRLPVEGSWSDTVTAAPRAIRPRPVIWLRSTTARWLTIEWDTYATPSYLDISGHDLRYARKSQLHGPPFSGRWTHHGFTGSFSYGQSQDQLGASATGEPYVVQMRVRWNDGHQGAWSEPLIVAPRAPRPAPVLSVSAVREGAVELDWTVAADPGGSQADSFNVRWIESSSTAKDNWRRWTAADNAGDSDDRSYVVEGLVAGTAYDMQVRGMWVDGPGVTTRGPWSNTLVIVAGEPLPVVGVAAAADDSRVAEGADAVFELTASPAPAAPLTVRVEVAASGEFGFGGVVGSRSVTFGAGESTATLTLTPDSDADDVVDEPNGSVVVTVLPESAEVAYAVGASGQASVTVVDDDEFPALTVTTVGVPDEHNGRRFEFEMHFSEPLSVSYRKIRDRSLVVTGGSVFGVGRVVRGQGDKWRVLIDPDGAGAVRVVLEAGLACGGPKALCSPAGVPLENGVDVVVGRDRSPPTVALELSEPSVGENGGAVMVSARLSGGTSIADTTVTVSVAGSDAAVDGPDVLTIPAGHTASSGSVTVVGVDNAVADGERTVSVTGSASNRAGVRNPAAASLRVTDDEAVPAAILVPWETEVGESVGEVSLSARLSAVSAADTRVTVSVSGADAAMDGSAVMTIPAGQTRSSGPVKVVWADNQVDDGDRQLTVSGVASNPAGVTNPADVVLTVVDDEVQPTVSLVLSESSVDEAAGSVSVRARLSHASASATTVSVSVSGGEASVDGSAVLTIPAGATVSSGSVSVVWADNQVDDADRTVTVSATAVNAAGVTAPADAVLTVVDDEDPPAASLVLSESEVAENGGTVSVTAELSHASSADTSVTVSVSGSGVDAVVDGSAVLTVLAGATVSTGSVTVVGVDNQVDDGDRTVMVSGSASNSSGVTGPGNVSLSVVDDEGSPVVSLVLSQAEVSEDAGSVSVTAELSHPSVSATSVTVSVSGSGADAVVDGSAVLTVPAGATASTGSVTVVGVDNAVDDGDRTVMVSGSASNSSGVSGPGDVSLSVVDDEGAPAVSLVLSGPSVGEDAGSVSVTAELSHPSVSATSVTVSVSGAGADAVVDGGAVLMIPAGALASSGSVTVAAVDNPVSDGDRTVSVSGSASNTVGVSGPDDVELRVVDDEAAPTVSLVLSASSVAEAAGSVSVTAELSHLSAADTTVTVTVTGGEASVLGSAVLTIPAGQTAGSGSVSVVWADNQIDDSDRTVTVSGSAVNSLGVSGPVDVSLTVVDDDIVRLTVTPANVPAEHNGRQFEIEMHFSETLYVSWRKFRDDSLKVTGGTIAGVGRVVRRQGDKWRVMIDPDGAGPVRVVLEADLECGQGLPGICTRDGRRLSNSLDVVVGTDPTPPAVTLALGDAQIDENGGTTTVRARLSHASVADTTVEVSVTGTDAVIDGPALLTVPAGQTASTDSVTLRAVDNDADDGDRQVTVTGTAANTAGATGPRSVSLTVVDDDEPPPPTPPPTVVVACFTDVAGLSEPATYTGAWDDPACRAHHRADSPARYFRLTLTKQTVISVELTADSGAALFVSHDTPRNGWGTVPGATYEHRVAVRLANGKLVHNATTTATLTLDPGQYTFEAAGTTGEFTLAIRAMV